VKSVYLLRPKAQEDLLNQALYLEREASLGVGHRFLVSAHQTFAMLAIYPDGIARQTHNTSLGVSSGICNFRLQENASALPSHRFWCGNRARGPWIAGSFGICPTIVLIATPSTQLATLYHFPHCPLSEILVIIIWLWPRYSVG
jgi:hypothetical protein